MIYCPAILSLLFINHLWGQLLDYDDVIYDQPSNDLFSDKIEQLQYAGLAIAGASEGTSHECLYNELRLESLSSRRCCRKLCAIYKLSSTQCP